MMEYEVSETVISRLKKKKTAMSKTRLRQHSAVMFMGFLYFSAAAICCAKKATATDEKAAFLPQLHTTDRTTDNIIIGFLNGSKESMTSGFPDIGLPPLDPAHIQTLRLDISEDTNKEYQERAQALANQYLDELFASAHFVIAEQGFDPISLPSDGDSFSMQIFNFPINGSLRLYDGSIGGLSTIHRTADSFIEYLNKELRIKANLGINNLKGSYTVEAKLFNFGPPVAIAITVSHLSVYLDLAIAISELNMTLHDFQINEIGSIDLAVSGIPLVDSVVTSIGESIINIVKDSLTFAIQEFLEPIIADQLGQLDLGDIIQAATYNCVL